MYLETGHRYTGIWWWLSCNTSGQTFSPGHLHESRFPKSKTPHPSKSKQLNQLLTTQKLCNQALKLPNSSQFVLPSLRQFVSGLGWSLKTIPAWWEGMDAQQTKTKIIHRQWVKTRQRVKWQQTVSAMLYATYVALCRNKHILQQL